MKTRLCLKCETKMQPTYEPYELSCPKCGFWFDTYTGKPVLREPEVISHDGDEYLTVGSRIGLTVDICYEPRMTVLIIGYNKDKRWWVGRYIVPAGMNTLATLTEDFLAYMDTQQ